MVLDNRHELFTGSDERVGTMFLWHFVEEIEHRSSALLIHHSVNPDRWYRIRNAYKVFDHVADIYKLVLAGFEEHVPHEDRHISTKAVGPSGLYLSELHDRFSLARPPIRRC
jgi:predicted metal-dependent hydrolase